MIWGFLDFIGWGCVDLIAPPMSDSLQCRRPAIRDQGLIQRSAPWLSMLCYALIWLIYAYHTYHILSHISHYNVDTVDTVAVRECYVWSQSRVTDECPHGHQSPSPKPGRWAQFPPAVPRNWHSWHCEMLRDHGEMALIVALNGIFMGYCWDINGILLWTYMNIY